MERMIPDCGEIPRGQFLYISSPELMLNGGDFVVYDTRTFIVRRADAIVFRNDRLFVWGLCVETGRTQDGKSCLKRLQPRWPKKNLGVTVAFRRSGSRRIWP